MAMFDSTPDYEKALKTLYALDYDEDGQNDDHDDSTGVSRRDNEIK